MSEYCLVINDSSTFLVCYTQHKIWSKKFQKIWKVPFSYHMLHDIIIASKIWISLTKPHHHYTLAATAATQLFQQKLSNFCLKVSSFFQGKNNVDAISMHALNVWMFSYHFNFENTNAYSLGSISCKYIFNLGQFDKLAFQFIYSNNLKI